MSDAEKTYEMLWDCSFCGQRKLLGKSQRHCPSCGGPQDPEKRYFPPEDEKVAVEDHEFVGADRECPACRAAQSAKAQCCTQCGSPLDGSRAVATRADVVVGDGGQAASAAPAKGKSRLGLILAAVAIVVVALIVVRFAWKQEAALVVEGHSWKRSVTVEVYSRTEKTASCGAVPAGAEILSREQEAPQCKVRKVDRGDGTYAEKEECEPATERCRYAELDWEPKREKVAESASLDAEPPWPSVTLARQGSCEGCEREVRKERFEARLKDAQSGAQHTCGYDDRAAAAKLRVGGRYSGELHALGGDLDCGSLVAK